MRFDIKAFGIRIKMLRNGRRNGNKKLTQEQMAVDLNICEQFLRKIEYGQRYPSIELLVEISHYFDVTMDYLILGKETGVGRLRYDLQDVIDALLSIAETLP